MSHVRPDSPLRAEHQPERPPGFPVPEARVRRTRGRRHHARHSTGLGDGFGSVVSWTMIGAVVPGSGLIVAGRRKLGRLLLAIALLAVGAGVVLAVKGDPLQTAAHVVASPEMLLRVAIGIAVATLLWVILVIFTHASLRHRVRLNRGQRILAGTLVTSLVLVGALPALEAARYALVARDTVESVFAPGQDKLSAGANRPGTTADPWAAVPRVNVLLIGSDAGKGRDRRPARHPHPRERRHQEWRDDPVQPAAQPAAGAVPARQPRGEGLSERVLLRQPAERRQHRVPAERHLDLGGRQPAVLPGGEEPGSDGDRASGRAGAGPADRRLPDGEPQGLHHVRRRHRGSAPQHRRAPAHRRERREPRAQVRLDRAGAQPAARRLARPLVRPVALVHQRLRPDEAGSDASSAPSRNRRTRRPSPSTSTRSPERPRTTSRRTSRCRT